MYWKVFQPKCLPGFSNWVSWKFWCPHLWQQPTPIQWYTASIHLHTAVHQDGNTITCISNGIATVPFLYFLVFFLSFPFPFDFSPFSGTLFFTHSQTTSSLNLNSLFRSYKADHKQFSSWFKGEKLKQLFYQLMRSAKQNFVFKW